MTDEYVGLLEAEGTTRVRIPDVERGPHRYAYVSRESYNQHLLDKFGEVRVRSKLPVGYKLKPRRSGLMKPRWYYCGPSTGGSFLSTGCTSWDEACTFVWDAVERGISLGEALDAVPSSSATEADKALLTYFGSSTPLRNITPEAIGEFVKARRQGIYRYKNGRRRPAPKDTTISRDVKRLRGVLEHAEAMDQWDGKLSAFSNKKLALRNDAKVGTGVFIEEYPAIRASMRSEGFRLILDFLTVFATDAIAAYRAKKTDVHIKEADCKPKHPHGYIDIRGSKTTDRGLPKPLNAQTRKFVERLLQRVADSDEDDPILFPEMRWKTGTQRKFSREFKRWKDYQKYYDRGEELTCMALRRTCFTALRDYWNETDCNRYIGHAVEKKSKPYDQFKILKLGRKIQDVTFPFLPPVEQGAIPTATGSAVEPGEVVNTVASCAASAQAEKTAYVPETQGESVVQPPPL